VLILSITSLIMWSACNPRKSQQKSQEFLLPLNLKATYLGSDVHYPIIGLVIEDELGFVVVGKEDKFLVNKDTVEVEKITKLGVGDFRLLIEVQDTRSDTFYIECIENNTGISEHYLSLIASDNIDMLKLDSIKWIDVDEIIKRLK